MKKFRGIILCFALIFSLIAFGAIAGKNKIAFAEGETDTPLTRGYFSTSDKGVYIDETLFSVLYRIAGRSDSTIPLNVFASVESLNLNFDNYSNIGLSTPNKILSLNGLEYFTLSSLKTLRVDGQGLTEINSGNFNSAILIESISAKNNFIETVDISSIDTLNALNLDNNQISEIDLSTMVKLGGNQPVVSLKNNKITDLTKLILPVYYNGNAPITLYLANNYLSGAVATNFPVKDSIGNNVSESGQALYHNVSLLFQKVSNNFVDKDKISVVPDLQYPKFNIRVYSTGTTSTLISRAGYMRVGQDNVYELTLGVGEFVLKFFNENAEIKSTSQLVGYEGLFYATIIKVRPKAPDFYLVVDGKSVEYTGAVDKEFKVYTKIDYEGAVVKMRVNGGDWQDATCITVSSRGTYKVETMIVVDGIESEVSSITVTNNNSDSIVLAVILIIGAVVVGFAVYFGVSWYKNGGVVAPFQKKK